ncbi:GAF and ANTAR domain-containing protein [Kocuria rosea]|uniref:GAF and ANTAR domain-containing protein n=1 Tax=Kocuria rosea TaxID=1275 RepID=UPI00203B12AB|nr:GAF and ANTAR domain-containing protein [Kocuria rosea]MCM3689116.1 GAF and ANTAR domain-containing protein [Kocuria rosea]
MSPESFPGELTTVFARLHGMLLSQHEATTAVGSLARTAHRLIPTATGAGVSLLDAEGTRVTTAATDPAVEAADALQYGLGVGPCLSAWATGEPQRITDTTTETRWRDWSAAAAGTGIRSVYSTPLVHQGRALGALKVYATTPSAFGEAEEELLGQLAAAAATLLGAAQPTEAPTRLSAALKHALATREAIGVASGVLMARDHLSAEGARTVLLEQARTQGRRVAEVAAAVLETA